MLKRLDAVSSGRGFTLLEALMAILVVSLFVVPASQWIYKVRKESQEIRRLEAFQVLQRRMNRIVVTGKVGPGKTPAKELPGAELEIRFEKTFSESRIIGAVRDKSGKTLATLVYPWFAEAFE